MLAIDGGHPVREEFLPFGAPSLGTEEIDEVTDTIRSGWIGTGPKTSAFESQFASYVDSPYAVAVNSCTAALHLSLLVAGIGPGDEVITTPLTFVATSNVIEHCRAKPVFTDIDPATLNIDPSLIEQAVTERTKAILPVHFGGLACAMDELTQIARHHRLLVIEDAAHAVGSRYHGNMVGSLGNLTCFSFYPNKNMTTVEGGMITTTNENWDEKLRIYRLHGLSRDAWKRYQTHRLTLSDGVLPGYKYNMTDIQASFGIHQLEKLESFLKVRENYADMYDEAFQNLPGIRLQPRPDTDGDRHALHLYVLILDPTAFSVGRNQIVDAFLSENIGAAIHYRAVHVHPFFRDKYRYNPEDFPVAYQIGENILSLPLSPAMGEDDVVDVIEAVRKVLGHFKR